MSVNENTMPSVEKDNSYSAGAANMAETAKISKVCNYPIDIFIVESANT